MEIIYEYLIHHDTIVTQLGSEKIFYPRFAKFYKQSIEY